MKVVLELDGDSEAPGVMGGIDPSIMALVQGLKAGAALGRAVAARRTPRADLGPALRAWLTLFERELSENASRLAALAVADGSIWSHVKDANFDVQYQDVDESAWRPTSESVSERDVNTWLASGWPMQILQPSHQQDRGPVMRVARVLVEAALDHLRGLATLLDDGQVTRPPMALARVILDATAHAYYLLEPDSGPGARLHRAVNELLDRLGEEYYDAVRSGDAERTDELRAEVEEIRAAVGEGEKWNWNVDRNRPPFIGDRPVTTAEMTEALLGFRDMWGELSGVVHVKEGEGWRLMLGFEAGLSNPHTGQLVAFHTLPAVVGLVRVVEVLPSYTGWNLPESQAAIEPLLNLWADAAGFNDDEHRARLLEEQRDVPDR
jgi:hypothetical protein